MNDPLNASEYASADRRPSRLDQRVITKSPLPDQRGRFCRRRTASATGTARRHWVANRAAVHPGPSTSLRPFAPGPLQALLRSYGRSDSCSLRRDSARVIPRRPSDRLLREQVSRIHAPGLPTLPSPNTCGCSASPRHVTYRWIEPRVLPHGSSPNGNSGLRLQLAGSPHRTGRIEFLIVRTGRSPPAAPHPVLPRRSCSRLQVYVEPGEDFHLPNQVRSQAH